MKKLIQKVQLNCDVCGESTVHEVEAHPDEVWETFREKGWYISSDSDFVCDPDCREARQNHYIDMVGELELEVSAFFVNKTPNSSKDFTHQMAMSMGDILNDEGFNVYLDEDSSLNIESFSGFLQDLISKIESTEPSMFRKILGLEESDFTEFLTQSLTLYFRQLWSKKQPDTEINLISASPKFFDNWTKELVNATISDTKPDS